MSIVVARPSRRTIVHGAAWSVPVVAIAVTAPAFAASTATSDLSALDGTAEKWGSGTTKHVSWDLLLSTGPVAIDEIRITFSYAPSSTGPFTSFEIYGHDTASGSRDASWTYPAITTPTSSLTATHLDDIPANTTYRIHTDFAGGDNASGTVMATAVISYVGTPGTVTQTVGPIKWGPGEAHVHPA